MTWITLFQTATYLTAPFNLTENVTALTMLCRPPSISHFIRNRVKGRSSRRVTCNYITSFVFQTLTRGCEWCYVMSDVNAGFFLPLKSRWALCELTDHFTAGYSNRPQIVAHCLMWPTTSLLNFLTIYGLFCNYNFTIGSTYLPAPWL